MRKIDQRERLFKRSPEIQITCAKLTDQRQCHFPRSSICLRTQGLIVGLSHYTSIQWLSELYIRGIFLKKVRAAEKSSKVMPKEEFTYGLHFRIGLYFQAM